LHVIFFTFDSATPKNTVKNDEIYPIFGQDTGMT